jgi:hypothetical protein
MAAQIVEFRSYASIGSDVRVTTSVLEALDFEEHDEVFPNGRRSY